MLKAMSENANLVPQLLETWDIHTRLNHFLLRAIPADAWTLKPAKGKSPQGHFSHMHNVRLMWLKSAAPHLLSGQSKLEDPSIEACGEALGASDGAIRDCLQLSFEAGKVKGFKPHPAAFLAYLISHEAYHRAQTELALRQSGHSLDDKVAYGLWEWGVR